MKNSKKEELREVYSSQWILKRLDKQGEQISNVSCLASSLDCEGENS